MARSKKREVIDGETLENGELVLSRREERDYERSLRDNTHERFAWRVSFRRSGEVASEKRVPNPNFVGPRADCKRCKNRSREE
jgi:hypothetical protein